MKVQSLADRFEWYADSSFETPACCGPKQSVQQWDFMSEGKQWVNRMCFNCNMHWYGPESDVLAYDKNQWNKLMEEGP